MTPTAISLWTSFFYCVLGLVAFPSNGKADDGAQEKG